MTAMQKSLGLTLLVWVAASPLAAPMPAEILPERGLGADRRAPIVMEVFSDHQCPSCRRFYLEVTRRLLADYAMKGKLWVVYREFPLERQHPYARQAARYTQAAGRLGQEEWIRVTDALYVYQHLWSTTGQLDPVVAGALPEEKMNQVRKWLKDPKLDAHIDRDLALGRRRGVRGTPTIFITANGKTEQIPVVYQYTIFRRYLDSLLAQAP